MKLFDARHKLVDTANVTFTTTAPCVCASGCGCSVCILCVIKEKKIHSRPLHATDVFVVQSRVWGSSLRHRSCWATWRYGMTLCNAQPTLVYLASACKNRKLVRALLQKTKKAGFKLQYSCLYNKNRQNWPYRMFIEISQQVLTVVWSIISHLKVYKMGFLGEKNVMVTYSTWGKNVNWNKLA